MEPFRQILAARLYNSRNTTPVKCSEKGVCPQNKPFCYAEYTRENATYSNADKVEVMCVNSTELSEVAWIQVYTLYDSLGLQNHGTFYCNIPYCASNATVIETFHWLGLEYILPVNVSVLNVTTTRRPTIITTTISSTTFTTSNCVSPLFHHSTIVVLCFIIIPVLH